jgi:arylsulfatase A-like enzyme
MVATISLALAPAVARGETARPNVVVIVTDDQRWDELDGMPVVRRELIGKGVTFSNGFVVNPLCCPSRTSILTGQYSHTSGVYREIPPYGGFQSLRDGSTLATWLDAAGYDTALVGKYIDRYQAAALAGYVPPGWDRWVAFVHSQYYDYRLSVDGKTRSLGHEPSDYSTDVLARYAEGFIRSAAGPLFLYFAPAAPHYPATPGPGLAGEPVPPASPTPAVDEVDVSDKPAWVRRLPRLGPSGVRAALDFRADQERTLISVDRAVGGILTALRQTDRLDNTLIVFMSDNGILLGEHRWSKKEAPYDEAIRIPFVVRWDRLGGPKGVADDEFALNVDVAPTVAAAAGVDAPGAEGVSLLPLVAGRHPPWRSDFLVEHMEGANPIPTFCAVRSETTMYVRYSTGEEELYDLVSDPHELANLAGDPSRGPTLAAARRRLAELCRPPPPGLYAAPARSFASTWVVVSVLASVLGGAAAAEDRRRRVTSPRT